MAKTPERWCPGCGSKLNQYNPGNLCAPCQEKRREQLSADHEGAYYTVEDMATILDLTSPESVKRIGRKGKLPPRIPGVRKWLWPRQDVDRWISSGHRLHDQALQMIEVERHYGELRDINQKILSNARKLSRYRNVELKGHPNLIEGGVINDGRYDRSGTGSPRVTMPDDFLEPIETAALAEAHLRHFNDLFPQFAWTSWQEVTSWLADGELVRALDIFGQTPFSYCGACGMCQAIQGRVGQR